MFGTMREVDDQPLVFFVTEIFLSYSHVDWTVPAVPLAIRTSMLCALFERVDRNS
jgi:hypothetical protein